MRLQTGCRFGCAVVAGILLAGVAHDASAHGNREALFKDKTATIMVGAAPGGDIGLVVGKPTSAAKWGSGVRRNEAG